MQACNLCILQELEQRGFFSDEGDDATPVPMADKTELGALKRAQLRMARSRPDLVYGLPEAQVAALASATLPYPERKARLCSSLHTPCFPCLPARTLPVRRASLHSPCFDVCLHARSLCGGPAERSGGRAASARACHTQLQAALCRVGWL